MFVLFMIFIMKEHFALFHMSRLMMISIGGYIFIMLFAGGSFLFYHPY